MKTHLPEICASTRRPPGMSSRNMVLGSNSPSLSCCLTPCSGSTFRVVVACWHISPANASSFHSDLARSQSYARDFTLRFVERANYLSPKVTTRSQLRVFRLADYESTTISKKALCQLQDREAQECGARDLQEPAP